MNSKCNFVLFAVTEVATEKRGIGGNPSVLLAPTYPLFFSPQPLIFYARIDFRGWSKVLSVYEDDLVDLPDKYTDWFWKSGMRTRVVARSRHKVRYIRARSSVNSFLRCFVQRYSFDVFFRPPYWPNFLAYFRYCACRYSRTSRRLREDNVVSSSQLGDPFLSGTTLSVRNTFSMYSI